MSIEIIDQYDNVVKTEVFKFPAGEVGVRVLPEKGQIVKTIETEIQSSDDVMALVLAVDAIRSQQAGHALSLIMPYVPYARQDRIATKGDALSIRAFASIINSLDFEAVIICDPHSDVTPALIKNSHIISQTDMFKNWMDYTDRWIVAPDLGAAKKAEKFCKDVGALGVLQCTKMRDPVTGKLSHYELLGSAEGKNVVVLDDILDKGGTFHLAADALAGAKSKILCVTHGLFTGGENGLTSKYDMIFVGNTYHKKMPENLKKFQDKIIFIDC